MTLNIILTYVIIGAVISVLFEPYQLAMEEPKPDEDEEDDERLTEEGEGEEEE